MKKLLSLLLVLAVVFSFMAISGTAFAADDTLTVYAWDANFNIPALKAAEAAYQKVNPNFKLEIATQSGSSDVEQAMTLAGSSGDMSSLPDIVLFQDHFIQSYVADYPTAFPLTTALRSLPIVPTFWMRPAIPSTTSPASAGTSGLKSRKTSRTRPALPCSPWTTPAMTCPT